MHIPTYKKHDGGDCAVMFIHGFMGGPSQFADLEAAVYEIGCSCVSVLLPGHGGGVDQFVKFGVSHWQGHVQEEIDKIKGDYRQIFLVGHSMGGLLALNASLVKENQIAAVMLLSTPLKINLFNPRMLWAKLRLLAFPKSHEIKAAYVKSNSLTAAKFFVYPLFVKAFINFYRLVGRTRARLSEVFVPVYMFHSKNDETTSYRSVALLCAGLCNTETTVFSLDKSWHAFYCAEEREIIKEQLIQMIREVGAGSE